MDRDSSNHYQYTNRSHYKSSHGDHRDSRRTSGHRLDYNRHRVSRERSGQGQYIASQECLSPNNNDNMLQNIERTDRCMDTQLNFPGMDHLLPPTMPMVNISPQLQYHNDALPQNIMFCGNSPQILQQAPMANINPYCNSQKILVNHIPPPDPQSFSANALEKLNLPQDKIAENGIIPDTPYYELPAALMAPLIAAEDRNYKCLNPADLRLPFPKFPDQNFLKMIDDFYNPNSKSRDNDGWDRSFIDTYLKQKEALAKID